MDKRTLITVVILVLVVVGIPALLFVIPGTREALFKTTDQSVQQSKPSQSK